MVFAAHGDVTAVEAAEVFTVDKAVAVVVDVVLAEGVGIFTSGTTSVAAGVRASIGGGSFGICDGTCHGQGEG